MTDFVSVGITLIILLYLYCGLSAMVAFWWTDPPAYVAIPAHIMYQQMDGMCGVDMSSEIERLSPEYAHEEVDNDPSRIEVIQQAYVTGKIDDWEFEQRISEAVERDERSKDQL